jgi:hypothetical protein
LCGHIRYSVPSTPLAVVACHCRDCQKQSGSALSLIAVFPKDELHIEGQCASFETSGTSGNPVARYFCSGCGSPVYSETKSGLDANLIFVKAGTLDDTTDLQPAAHYWVESRQPWFPLPEGAVCVERE